MSNATIRSIAGRIEQVNASSIVVGQPPRTSLNLELSATTQFFNQVPGTTSDVQPGASLMAVGLPANNTVQVFDIMLGADQTFIPPQSGTKIITAGDNPGPTIVGGPSFFAGTVKQFDGTTLIIQNSDGETIHLSVGARINVHRFEQVTADIVKVGKIVRATCVQSENSLQVHTLYILNPPPMPLQA